MEWSPWIKHTPGPCPVGPSVVVIAQLEDGHVLSPMEARDIDWLCPGDDVTRYRMRKPKGLQILEGILREADASVQEATQ